MADAPQAVTEAEFEAMLRNANAVDFVNLKFAVEYGAIVIVEDHRG